MGNLNFAHNAGFSWYCLLLMLSGILMVVLGVVRNQRLARRVVRVVLGVAYFGYGFYLTFVFTGGHYWLFFQAFLLPVLVLADTLRGGPARRRMAARQTGI
jgi:ABC-type iron transport system FetAB permease component